MNSKQVNETVNKLFSFMQNVKDGDLRTILVNMQNMNDYMAEKLRIYEEHLTLLTVPFTGWWKKVRFLIPPGSLMCGLNTAATAKKIPSCGMS